MNVRNEICLWFYKIRNVLRHNILLIHLRLISRGENPKNYIVVRNNTDICIDGYPRSANSFSVRMFNAANPTAIVAHHTHSTGNLAKALKYNLPVVVLIREPLEAIVSTIIATKKSNAYDAICRYLVFYQWVLKYIDEVVIADFNVVASDFNTIISAVNDKYGSTFNYLDDVRSADQRVKQDIEVRYKEMGKGPMSHIKPIPNADRLRIKDNWERRVKDNFYYESVCKLYSEVIKRSNQIM